MYNYHRIQRFAEIAKSINVNKKLSEFVSNKKQDSKINKTFTKIEIIEYLNECKHLDDAKIFFHNQ